MSFIAPHYNKAKKKSVFAFLKHDRFFVKTPWWLKRLYANCLWDMPYKTKTLYLTFDDGPHPTITPFLLDLLDKYKAKATFFCIGDNVEKFPAVYQQVIQRGHAVGNHTQYHLNGWKTDLPTYLNDVATAQKKIDSKLFRPPYGRISREQIKQLVQNDKPYKIIMWNILAGDWVQELKPEDCYKKVAKKITDGDIIVFHDSEKAWNRMSYAVPKLLEEFSIKGFSFKVIE
jgi:peptidoglycan-N-acetylglucosamine deacetylase